MLEQARASCELRLLREEDLPAVQAVQIACYGADFVEAQALIQRRLRAAPDTHWVAELAGQVQAYLCAHAALRGQTTALHDDFAPAAPPDTLYLHDLAVHPQAHGTGLGPRLVRHALIHARQRGWQHAALVSVQDSRTFWESMGFEACALPAPAQARLASYPGQALYMGQRLAGLCATT